MALLPPLAGSARMSAAGVDTHGAFYSSHVDMAAAATEAVVLTFRGGEEGFQSQEESPLPLPPVRRKRLMRRFTESSSEDEYVPKARRNKHVSYCESESNSSSDNEARHALSSSSCSRHEKKLKLVLELLSQSKTIESVLHVGCRIQSWEAVATKPELPIGVLRGCPSCRTCQKVVATWRPEAGRRPIIEEAPVFYPNEEEFQQPLRYIASIRARAEPYGICRVVPPPSWKPPCPLRSEVQSMQFPTRVQQVHKLQVRQPTAKECSPTKQASKKRRGRGSTRMGASPLPNENEQPEFFGFWPGDPFPLGEFEKYANDFKDQYFRIGPDRKWEPTVEMIEGEYWRIVEQATDQIEVLYGADVETGKFGSGFPKCRAGSEAATHYEKSGWNLNNIARYPGSMLSFEEGDISGVLVPWLYIGMCFSSFCWHVEDHHFYSLNCMHWGAPKIWYGVPGFAANKLEAAMKKHLPDLFSEQPDLLHKLVTQLSPSFLKQEGVPVYRVVQQPGDFVITFPNAYHSGFNAGFNVAEAVNVAPVDWLPHGQAAVELYRELNRKTSVSHDKLLFGAARVALRMWCHSQQSGKVLSERERAWQLNFAGGLQPGLVSSWRAYCGEGGVLAKALKERVEMERARRESLKSSCGEALTLTSKRMDSNYDSSDERECEVCKYDLHLSAVGCECSPDRFACLLHGHLLCQCPWSKKTLFYRYNLEQLALLLAAVECRPGAVANWAKQHSPPDALSSKLTVVTESKFQGLHPHTGVTESKFQGLHPHTIVQIAKKETAIQSSNALGPVRKVTEEDVSSQPPQKPVFLKSGHARSLARKDSPELNGSSKLANPAPALDNSKAEVILLSDDEEEAPTCKLNEASFSAAEVASNDLLRTTVCATNRTIEGDDAVNTNQVRSPVKERVVVHTSLPVGVPEERAASARPLNDLVTVVQRGTCSSWTPNRVARVRLKMEVDVLDVGRLIVREGWYTKHAIYPAGFKSRVRFINVEDVFKTCIYISEIIDRGLSAGPLFQVTHPTKREVYLHDSIDGCWHDIQNHINETIIALRPQKSHLQLPPLLPPPSGLEMFGLTSPSVIEAVEALDPHHQCSDYWTAKQSLNHQRPDAATEPMIQRPGIIIQRPDATEVKIQRPGTMIQRPGTIQRPDATEPHIQRAGIIIQRPDATEVKMQRPGTMIQRPGTIQRPDATEPHIQRAGIIIQRPDATEPHIQRAGIITQRPDATEPHIQRAGIIIQRPDATELKIQRPETMIRRPNTAEPKIQRPGMIQRFDATEPNIQRAGVEDQPLRAPQTRIVHTNSGINGFTQEIRPPPEDRSQNAEESVLQGLFQKATPAELRVMYRVFSSGTQGAEWRNAFRALTQEVQRRF